MTIFLILLNLGAGLGNVVMADVSWVCKFFGFANTLVAGFLIGQAIMAALATK